MTNDPYDDWKGSGPDLYRVLPIWGEQKRAHGDGVDYAVAVHCCAAYHSAVSWLKHDWAGLSRELEIPSDIVLSKQGNNVRICYDDRARNRGASCSLQDALSDTENPREFASWVFEELLRRLFKLRLLGVANHGMLRPTCLRFIPNMESDGAPSRVSGRLMLGDTTLKAVLPLVGTDSLETQLQSSGACVRGRMFFAPETRAGTETDVLQTADIYSTAMLTCLCLGIIEESSPLRGPDDPRELLTFPPNQILPLGDAELDKLPGPLTRTKLLKMLNGEPSRRGHDLLGLLYGVPAKNNAGESTSLSRSLDALVLTVGQSRSFKTIEKETSAFVGELRRSASGAAERTAAEALCVARDYAASYHAWNLLRWGGPKGDKRLGTVVDAVLEAARASKGEANTARFLALACCFIAVTHMARGRPRTATRVMDQAQLLAKGAEGDAVGNMFGLGLLALQLDFVLESGSYHDRLALYRKLRARLAGPEWCRWFSSSKRPDPKLVEFLWSVANHELELTSRPGLLQAEYYMASTFDQQNSWLLKHLVRCAIRFSRRIDLLRGQETDPRLHVRSGVSHLEDPIPRFELESLGVEERDLGPQPKRILRGYNRTLKEWRSSLRRRLRRQEAPEAVACGELLIHGTLFAKKIAADTNSESEIWPAGWTDLQLQKIIGPQNRRNESDVVSRSPRDQHVPRLGDANSPPYRSHHNTVSGDRDRYDKGQLEDRLVELMDSFQGLYVCLAHGKPGNVELLEVSYFRVRACESRAPSPSHRIVRQLCYANVETFGMATFPISADPRYTIVVHRSNGRRESVSVGLSGEPLRMYCPDERERLIAAVDPLIRATLNRGGR